jgi:GDP-4-dehydro-6-deoxy-D-mannose reductase
MKALVTGAYGFVGTYLMRQLLSSGCTVVAAGRIADRDASLFSAEFASQVASESLDIMDWENCSSLMSRVQPDVVYHLAANAFVPSCEQDFAGALAVNVAGTGNVVRALHENCPGSRFVFISSAEVYGKVAHQDLPIHEQVSPRPNNNYSLSKLMAEEVCQRYARYGKIAVGIARPFNHLGRRQSKSFVASSFAHQLAQIAIGAVPPVVEVGNLSAERDFSDVRDIVRGYCLLAEKLTPKENADAKVYNFCSGIPHAISHILDTLIAISDQAVEVRSDPERMRPSEVPLLFGSSEKARLELGWEPQYSLAEALAEVYADAKSATKE